MATRKSFQIAALEREKQAQLAEEAKHLGCCGTCDGRQGHTLTRKRPGVQPKVRVDCIHAGGEVPPPTVPEGGICPYRQPAPIFPASKRKK